MALESVVVTGLKAVYMADLGKISTATWKQIGYTKEGQVTVNFDAPTSTPVKVEELDDPILSKFEKGAKSLEFDFVNLSDDMLKDMLGATIDTSGTSEDVISIPDNINILRKMLKLEFLTGLSAIVFTNTQLASEFGGEITKTGDGTFNIHTIATVNSGLGGTSYESTGVKLLKSK